MYIEVYAFNAVPTYHLLQTTKTYLPTCPLDLSHCLCLPAIDRPTWASVIGSPVWFGLVYWGLTPQQQPGSYQGGEMMMKSGFFMVEEIGVPGGNHRPTASN